MPNSVPQITEIAPEKYGEFQSALEELFKKTGKPCRPSTIKDANREIIGFDFPCADGSVARVGPTFFPWIAHERNTWPHRYMTTKVPLSLRIWNGHHWKNAGHADEYTEKPLPIGTRVKIVMASRFGDVGITDDLTAENGYHLRVPIDELQAKFENFSMEP